MTTVEPPRRTVLMFAGLGSQAYHMGQTLFQREATFRGWMLRLDRLAQRLVAWSVLERIYSAQHRRGDPFHAVLDSYLSIYMVEVAMAETLLASGVKVHGTLASSMGFFAAATVAGCLRPDDAMTMLVAQARAVEACCPPGGMLAILGPLSLYDDPAIANCSEIAGVSMPSHFVVAADPEGLSRVERRLRQRHVLSQRLAVDYAFHSHWIENLEAPLRALLAPMSGRPMRIPIACCARVAHLDHLTDDCLWTIARQPIRFSDTIAFLEARGPHLYIDAGPSGSLAGAVKSALSPHSRSDVAATMTPFHREMENLERIVGFSPAFRGQ